MGSPAFNSVNTDGTGILFRLNRHLASRFLRGRLPLRRLLRLGLGGGHSGSGGCIGREGEHAQQRHLEPGLGIGADVEIPVADEGDLVIELHGFRGEGALLRLPESQAHRHAVQRLEQFFEHRGEVGGFIRKRLAHREHPARVAAGECFENGAGFVPAGRPHHGGHIIGGELAPAVGNRLVGNGQGIAHAATGRLGDDAHRIRLEFHAFRGQHFADVPGDLATADVLQLELQAARQHCDRHFPGIGGCEQELHMLRRFLQRLQEGVEARRGQHVHLVDEIDLEAPPARQVLRVLQQFPGIVDPGAGSGVDLDQVDEAVLLDLPADRARPAGRRGYPRLAVQALGENARDGGLADTPGAGEEIRMVDAPRIQPVAQRPDHVILADKALEIPGTQPPG